MWLIKKNDLFLLVQQNSVCLFLNLKEKLKFEVLSYINEQEKKYVLFFNI